MVSMSGQNQRCCPTISEKQDPCQFSVVAMELDAEHSVILLDFGVETTSLPSGTDGHNFGLNLRFRRKKGVKPKRLTPYLR